MKLVTVLLTLLVALPISVALALAAELMIVGNDEKVGWDDAGKAVFSPPGKDTVSIIDIGSDPLAPRVTANLQLMNSIFGPPVNLAITPDERLAIVANSMTWVPEGSGWKPTPDNKLYVTDLTTRDLSILKVENGTVTDTGKRVALPGSPASMRGRAR